MTKSEKQDLPVMVLVGAIFAGITLLLIGSFISLNGDIVDEIRRGDKSLWCEMSDGYRQIDGKLLTDFIDGTWYFVNGQAKNCEVINAK